MNKELYEKMKARYKKAVQHDVTNEWRFGFEACQKVYTEFINNRPETELKCQALICKCHPSEMHRCALSYKPTHSSSKEEDKPVLFTTEDGVDIKKVIGFIWLVNHAFYPTERSVFDTISLLKEWEGKEITFKLFSTKEKAEQYILENKPCLSLKDLLEVWDKHGMPLYSDRYKSSPMYKNFEEKAKTKL